MLDILFTFIMTYFLLSVCWFVPEAGKATFKEPTKKEILLIGAAALIPTLMVAVML
tara:strand:+ start:1407 stop:1574 length:168 start_codon:yes stop_codon:yes gene_type:complete